METQNQTQEQPQNAKQDSEAVERQEILDGLTKLSFADRAEDATAEDEQEPEAAPEDQEQGDEEADPESKDDGEAETEAEPEPEAKVDPDLEKRLESIQKAEAKSREAIAQARADLKAEQDAFAAQMAELRPQLEQFNALKQRAMHDPAGVLSALGVDLAEVGEIAARQIYSMSNAAQNDPKTRESAQSALRNREMASRLDALEKKNQELLQQMQEQQAKAQQAQQAREYMDGLTKSISDEAPLVARKLANSPEATQRLLAQVATELLNEHDEVPDYGDVINRLESQLKTELNSLGIDPSAVLVPKKQTQAAGEKKTAKSLSQELGSSPTKPRTEPQTEEELDAEILEGLRRQNS